MIKNNIFKLKNRIREYEARYGRKLHSVHLLVVSKKQSVENIQQAFSIGQLAFGENYLQEALPKIIALQQEPIEWHFIGTIQRNKTRKIAEYFSWVHSVCDSNTAKRLNDQRPLHLPPLNICLQINLTDDPRRAGILPKDIASVVAQCQLDRLRLRGLMTLPLPQTTLDAQRLPYRQLKNIFDDLIKKGLQLDTLSMGMSDDFEAAIAEGSTLVRIGTAVFGKR